MFKRILAITAVSLLALTAGATTLIIPASGTGAGAGGSHWETELYIHNATSRVLNVTLTFHDSNGASTEYPYTIGPRTTAQSPDVVNTIFGKTQATGAIEVKFDDSFANRVAVTSRTLNTGTGSGMFGQDVPAVDVNDALAAGDVAVISVPLPSEFRLNAGVYAVTDSTVNWELVRQNGTIAATKEVSYTAGQQIQYNNIVGGLLNAASQQSDTIYANVTSGSAIAYGSAIDNGSGSPVYVPGVRTKADSHIAFGVDVNYDGKIDISDADGDGVLDSPVNLYTIGYPNYLRVIVLSDGGANAKIEIVGNSVPNVSVIDDQGTIAWAPTGDAKGTTTSLKVKITVNGVSDVVTIPATVK
jgi:hypothetical protein